MLSNEKSQSLRISIQDEDAIFEISFKIKEEVKKIMSMNNRYVNICILSYNSLIKTEKKTIDGDQHACASCYGN
jgi:hypothetical protein